MTTGICCHPGTALCASGMVRPRGFKSVAQVSCSPGGTGDQPQGPSDRGLSPFMRSRMKLSLSGVWKAYDMHTMNGQS